MGRRKNANPQKNEGGANTEQLGGSRDRDLSIVKEPTCVSVEASLPPPSKRRRIVESDDEDDGQDTVVINEVTMADAADAQVTIESSLMAENGKNQWTIHLGIDENEETHVPGNSEWTLRQYRLLRTQCLSSDGAELNSSSVSAFDGAVKVLQHCESICSSDSSMDWSLVAKAIENGTLRLDCCRAAGDAATVDISISLTERAFELCSSDRLPLYRRASGKKYQSSTQLHQALAQLFPDSVVADAVKKQTVNPITAKTVYDLIDNVKLQEYEENGGYDCKPMSIPGLVPTLRPYQEAAVKWMVERENQRASAENREWELAWVVLADPAEKERTHAISDNVDGILIRNREVLFLPEWKRRMQAVDIMSCVLYCPFSGFLVTSAKDAYMATLNSFLSQGDGSEWTKSRGGILAESMGLGKTVEVLACLLANQRPKDEISAMHFDDLASMEEEKKDDDEQGGTEFFEKEYECVPIETWVDHFGACICGSSDSFRGCLDTVLCQSCQQPMHGICAGFCSHEEIQANTSNEVVGGFVVPVCSRKRCPTCVFADAQESKKLVESGATLIVTPAAILSQWEREIRRHVGFQGQAEQKNGHEVSPIQTFTNTQGLKVLIYPGVKELCNRGNKANGNASSGSSVTVPPIHLIHPRILADADVVLMTFDSLRDDLGHSSENPYVTAGRLLRTEKRYRVLPSPLMSIKWWRVCLDEAQRVETPTATSAKMALKLTSQFRWCVSGTPIGRGNLDDLFGLFLFLKLGPFSSKKWFQACLHSGLRGVDDRISHLLSTVIWRSTKESDGVAKQIGIPEQTEKRVVLKFSSIERHFYERQLECTLDVATDVMNKKRRTKYSENLLASHIHQLRAACCHPQVGSHGIGRARKNHLSHSRGGGSVHSTGSVGSSVLTMDQILDRLIDDARGKCEEAQRLAVMHTNALGSLEKLKIDAKEFGVDSNQTDVYHLSKSTQIYLEVLDLMDSNASPSAVIGEAVLSGCNGFLARNTIVRDGKARLEWHMQEDSDTDSKHRALWSRIDFETPKKVVEMKVRPVTCRGQFTDERNESANIILIPRDCIFQVSSAAVGGEFIDVVSFSIPVSTADDDGWLSLGAFHTNRSKSWRILIKTYHRSVDPPPGETLSYIVGLDVELMEPDIAADSLQRLHALNNAVLTMTLLLDHYKNAQNSDADIVPQASFMTLHDMQEKVGWMQAESRNIESLYLNAARNVQAESQRQLQIATDRRKEVEARLCTVSPILKSQDVVDFWQESWWYDLLSTLRLHGTEHERSLMCERVQRDLADFADTLDGSSFQRHSFSRFYDVDGISVALNLRFRSNEMPSHAASMEQVSALPLHPSESEIANNARCHKCRADWNQTGPKCNHCKLETKLNKLDTRDPIIIVVLKSLHRWLLETRPTSSLVSKLKPMKIEKRAEYFFGVLKASERELRAGRLAWRTHFDLLSDLDEMNQCKQTIRLPDENEDLTRLTQDELGSIVAPCDINARAMEHSAKQAMALATLRRSKDTLRYLKNQNMERLEEQEQQGRSVDEKTERNVCILCLSTFEGDRAVLACGHSFHDSPCLERLIAKAGNHQTISCPLRCTTRTRRDEVMIASDKPRDDGSRSNRKVIGSWGTKVTRLLSDLMDVSDRAEKSIVFSQWEDMLDVVEEALKANNVAYVRAKTLRKIGRCVNVFRSSQCTVLLLNIKNGAEGLTLVEANHCFMLEPLLNCGLDSQAINRIHRIGQRSKTYVHRYLIQDTIEEKIEKIRVASYEDQLEDALNKSRKKHDVSAGGIDGGFSHEQLQDILH